ncbi:MAG: WecB/TagA/CpsF family glycosyltransferase [Rickettsiales bacterium]|nr:WecB/TagA/CpsF family glycosyltransferase [Rickettsiales bacterium]
MEETLALIGQAITKRQSLQHVVVNVAKLVHCQKDEALYHDVSGSDLINIDGMGVVWGARMAGFDIPERVAGVDLMDNTLKFCAEKGYRPYILGAKPEILEQAVENLTAKYPVLEFAGTQHGYYDRENEQQVMEAIRDSKPDCLFIAISSPHKERIMGAYKEMMDIPFIMGVGGSVDVFAGFVTRAPQWMQKRGLEWLYRIIQEPRRMWKRYAVTNSRFIWLLLKLLTKMYRPPSYMSQAGESLKH